ncbi:MAG: response regulator transcription factor [Bacteroidetes bacterium]|nr:response regulator transcription factor [Bacteroidota bacterium]
MKYEHISVAVAEDHAIYRTELCAILRCIGFSIHTAAEHGAVLLAQLQQAATLPHICLLDINMPIMDGIATAKAIRQQWTQIKLIAHSMNAEPATIAAMLQAGADAYIPKGNIIELRNKIIALCG